MKEAGIITAAELKKMLDTGGVDVLFDLRNQEEFSSWRIEGGAEVPALNIPQADFVGEEERHLPLFPAGKNIVTVCAHGDAAKYAADLLAKHGLSALSVAGGMDAWSELYEIQAVPGAAGVHQVIRVARGCLGYLIESNGDAAVIDASRHIDRIEKLASELGVNIAHVFETHLHADHISGGMAFGSRTGAAYHMHPADAPGSSISFLHLEDGQSFRIGSRTLEVLHSPGHTPGSTSFLLDKTYLFTGDTIMKTSIGRPDLGGMVDAWALLLHDTLFRKFARLGDDIVVLPAHAASVREQDRKGIISTTLGAARKEGDLFRAAGQKDFLRAVRGKLLENPERYQEIRKVNLGLLTPAEPKLKELEIGKNLCGMAGKTADAPASG